MHAAEVPAFFHPLRLQKGIVIYHPNASGADTVQIPSRTTHEMVEAATRNTFLELLL